MQDLSINEHENTLTLAGAMGEIENNRERLEQYALLLSSSNQKARLTGPREPGEIMNMHVRDCAFSLALAPDIGHVVDIGTGGGLPGIVWAVCRPKLRVTLVESVERKCSILKEIVRALRLENTDVACERSETLAMDRRERFGIALSRAVGHLGVVAEYASPLVRIGGFACFFKGPKVEGELQEVGDRWSSLGFGKPLIHRYDMDGKKLCLVRIDKVKECPARYPRNPGRANKSVWWR